MFSVRNDFSCIGAAGRVVFKTSDDDLSPNKLAFHFILFS